MKVVVILPFLVLPEESAGALEPRCSPPSDQESQVHISYRDSSSVVVVARLQAYRPLHPFSSLTSITKLHHGSELHTATKSPAPLTATGVSIVTFKVWKNTIVVHLQQDAHPFHFLPGGKYPHTAGGRIW